MHTITIYCDGSNTYNGKPYSYGGYGAAIYYDEDEAACIEFGGSMEANVVDIVTNNKAEILALIKSIKYCLDVGILVSGDEVKVYTDSQYVVGVATGSSKIISNRLYWLEWFKLKKTLIDLGISCKISWLRGHAGNVGNERADKLAKYHASLVKHTSVELKEYHEKQNESILAETEESGS